jgi:hypothetical protein
LLQYLGGKKQLIMSKIYEDIEDIPQNSRKDMHNLLWEKIEVVVA